MWIERCFSFCYFVDLEVESEEIGLDFNEESEDDDVPLLVLQERNSQCESFTFVHLGCFACN